MRHEELINKNIDSFYPLPSPHTIHCLLPMTEKSTETVLAGRGTIQNILDGKDSRIFVVIGPCSIHDPKAALEYAEKLKVLADTVSGEIVLVMRVYFEKPRTTTGWKGLINDPFMDDSFRIEEGLKIARKLLLDITGLGLVTATEALDPITPQYLSELICWSAIGARTTESQIHRQMVSGLSMPAGFKNGTDGNIQVAIDAMKASLAPHHFLGIDLEGRASIFDTKGNPYTHLVLRGGNQKTNYDAPAIAHAEELLRKNALREKIMIDCSHGNSNKDHKNQPKVFDACIDHILEGKTSICSLMVESNLFEGSQSIPADLTQLKYGVSVTDKCIDWPTTESMILEAHRRLAARKIK